MTLQQSGVGGAPPPAAVARCEPPRRGRSKRRPRAVPHERLILRASSSAALVFMTLVFVFPFIWLVSASLKTRADVFSNQLFIVSAAVPELRRRVRGRAVANWFMNSVLVTVLAAVTVTISSAIVAFAFAYFRFPGRNLLFGSSWPA